MIYEYPEYYTRFSCIGGECKDSCCIGWEIDIDYDTYEYYKSIEGEFGKRLEEHMTKNGERSFVLGADNRCPFLNNKNLCDIYSELGEESLCKICTEYPRYYESIGNYQQIDMSLSCMEVGRLFTEGENYISYNKRKDKVDGEVLSKEEVKRLEGTLSIRDLLIEVVKCKKISWMEKCFLLIRLAEEKQDELNKSDYKAIKKAGHKGFIQSRIKNFTNEYLKNDKEYHIKKMINQMHEINALIKELEVIDCDWSKMYEIINKKIGDIDFFVVEEFNKEVADNHEIWYENLLIYFMFRYFLRSFYDGSVIIKTKFAVVSAIYIYMMDIVRWLSKGKKFDLNDRIDISHLYSKEIEHSEENILYLMDELMFMEIDL